MQGTLTCSQQKLVELIDNLSQSRKDAIQSIAFGSLLKYKNLRIERSLCKAIANTFDPTAQEFSIDGKKVKMTIDEVDQILGLPAIGPEIYDLPKRKVPDFFQKYKWNNDTSIKLASLKEDLKQRWLHLNFFALHNWYLSVPHYPTECQIRLYGTRRELSRNSQFELEQPCFK
jgi:hypothetical protein